MGKKSRRNRGSGATSTQTTETSQSLPTQNENAPSPTQNQTQTTPSPTPVHYPSDGPSVEELNCLQTTSTSLQTKLNQLVELANQNDRANFVKNFVPLDLSQEDADGYLYDLTKAPEAEGQWTNLVAEIAAIAQGKNVNHIEGDQITKAIFFFEHPLLQGCDREVSFVCIDREWRAEG